MKPAIEKVQDPRGRISVYRATCEGIEAEGQTAREASEACMDRVRAALGRLDRGVKFGTIHGHTFMVWPSLYGWHYRLDTFSDEYACFVDGSREDCVLRAVNHLAQNIWTHEVDDRAFLEPLPLSIQSDLKSWIRFQRAYRWLADGGIDPRFCHDTACRLVAATA